MPQSSSPSAVIVTGGKQYFVSQGDRVLVDRLEAEPGAEIVLDRVLLATDGGEAKLGSDLQGLTVTARVISHEKGPKVLAFRYKSKKHVRVHRGTRAHLTALEIVAVGDRRDESKKDSRKEASGTAASKPAAARRTRKAETAKETGDGA